MIETSTRLSGFVVLKLGLGQEFQEFWPADSKRSEKKPADVHYSYVFIVLFFVLVCSDVSLCHGSFLDQRKNQLMFIIRMFFSCLFVLMCHCVTVPFWTREKTSWCSLFVCFYRAFSRAIFCSFMCLWSFLDQRKNQLMFIIRMFLSCFFSCLFVLMCHCVTVPFWTREKTSWCSLFVCFYRAFFRACLFWCVTVSRFLFGPEKKPADVHYSYVFIVLFLVLVCSDVSLCHGSFLDQRKNQLMFIIRMFLSCFFSCLFVLMCHCVTVPFWTREKTSWCSLFVCFYRAFSRAIFCSFMCLWSFLDQRKNRAKEKFLEHMNRCLSSWDLMDETSWRWSDVDVFKDGYPLVMTNVA